MGNLLKVRLTRTLRKRVRSLSGIGVAAMIAGVVIGGVGATSTVAETPLLATRHPSEAAVCRDCHGDLPPTKDVSTDRCLRCHDSYETLVQKPNIYISHIGKPSCDKCHHFHKPSELYCSGCHDEFEDIKVP
jgi:hypothetical protein